MWYIDASEIAMHLGSNLLANIVMVGVLISTGLLPLKKEIFQRQLEASFEKERLTVNMKAFTMGLAQNLTELCSY